jgi:uncharacterized membrane protein YfcA
MTAHLRQHVPWRELLPLTGLALATLPLGARLLWLCSHQTQGFAKVGLGVLLLVVLLIQWLCRVPPRENVARGWGVLAGVTSGVLAGFANIGGPPLIMWIHAHTWPNEKTRTVIPAMSLVMAPVQIGVLLVTFGTRVLPSAGAALLLASAILVGTGLGLWAGRRLSPERLRTSAYGLLLLTCLACILSPLMGKG